MSHFRFTCDFLYLLKDLAQLVNLRSTLKQGSANIETVKVWYMQTTGNNRTTATTPLHSEAGNQMGCQTNCQWGGGGGRDEDTLLSISISSVYVSFNYAGMRGGGGEGGGGNKNPGLMAGLLVIIRAPLGPVTET